MTQIKIFTAYTNHEDHKKKWLTDDIHRLQRKVNQFLALYDDEIEVKDIKYSTQCMYSHEYIHDEEKIWTVMIIYEKKDVKSGNTNENAKKLQKDALRNLGVQSLVFRPNPACVQKGTIPYLCGKDFAYEKYIIRAISIFDYEKNGLREDGEIIATYNSLDEIIDAGWMLEID